MNLSQEEANNREADAVEAECCLLAAAPLVITFRDSVQEYAEDKREASITRKAKSDIMIINNNNKNLISRG